MPQGKAYTDQERQEIIERICDKLMDGLSLRKICQSPDMPNKTTILRWLNDPDDNLAPIIARAREYQADALDDDIQDITTRMLEGEIGHQEARTAIWAIQWRASKLKPKKYGDKLALGSDPENPLTLLIKEISGNTLRPRDDAE